jgi:hypothetical protein
METKYPSTPNQNWQDAVEPRLMKRVQRPLVQFGVSDNQLARAIQSRTRRVSHRLPLLTKLIQPWIDNIGYFQFQLNPNDHILSLPDFDSSYELPDINAAFDSQSPAKTSIPIQLLSNNNTEEITKKRVPKFTLITQAKHQPSHHKQPLSSLDLAEDENHTSSTNNPKQNISLSPGAIATSQSILSPRQEPQKNASSPSPSVIKNSELAANTSQTTPKLDLENQLQRRLFRPIIQPGLLNFKLADVVQLRMLPLSDRLPLLTQLAQHQPHKQNLQIQKKSDDQIYRLSDFDSSQDLTKSVNSQAIAKSIVSDPEANKVNISDVNSNLKTAKTTIIPIQRKHQNIANVEQFSTNDPKQNISLSPGAIATSKPILTLGQEPQKNTSSVSPSVIKNSELAANTSQTTPKLDLENQLQRRLFRPIIQPGLLNFKLADVVQLRMLPLSDRLPLLTQLAQHQPHKQNLQIQKKSDDQIYRLSDFDSSQDLTKSVNSQAIAKSIVSDPEANKVNISDVNSNLKTAKTTIIPIQRKHQNIANVEQFSTNDPKQNISLSPSAIATSKPILTLGQEPQKNTSSVSPSVIKNSELAANTSQTTPKLDLENQLQRRLFRPIIQPGLLNFKLADVVQLRMLPLSDRLPLLTQLAQHQPHKQNLQIQKKSDDQIYKLSDFDSEINSPELASKFTLNGETFLTQQPHRINQTNKPRGSANSRKLKANKPIIVQAKIKHPFTHQMLVEMDNHVNLPSASVIRLKRNSTTTIPAQAIKQFIDQQKTLLPSSVVTQNNGLASSSIPMNAREQTAQKKSNSTPNHQVHSSEQKLQRRLQRPLIQSSIIGSQLVRIIHTRKHQLTNSQPLLAQLVQRQHSRYNNQTQLNLKVDVERSPQEFRHPSDLKVIATEDSSPTNPSKFQVIKRSQPHEQPMAIASPRQNSSNFTQQSLQSVKPMTVSRSKFSGFSNYADIVDSPRSAKPMTAILPPKDHVVETQSLAPQQRTVVPTNENNRKIQRSTVRPLVKEINRKKLPSSPIMPLVVSNSSLFEKSKARLQPTNLVMSGTHNSFINRAQASATIPSNSSQMKDTQSHTNNQNNSVRIKESDRESAIDVDDLADRVMQKVMRQLAIESERRGGSQWP